MAERSFAARRSDAWLTQDFPAIPVLGADLPSFGFMLVGNSTADLIKLKPFRNQLAAVWQGQIDSNLGEQSVLIVLFAELTDITPLRLGNVLRLSAGQGRALTSFASQFRERINPQDTVDPGALTQIDIWWGGSLQRLMLNAQSRLSLSQLWDMPDIHVHSPLRPDVAAEGLTNETIAERATGLLSPRQAQIPIEGAAEISFEDAADRDRMLDERTRLKSIGAQIWNRLTGGQASSGHGQQREGGPGILANMAGWLLWHTPLGMPVAKQFAQRMKLVEQLMASSDVDSALRLALRLGSAGSGQQKKIYPTGLPGMRASLDFDISERGFVAPIMGNSGYHNLHSQYNELAERLERDGDFKRAAYIRAQLQGNHHAAVLTLARGELFLDAAKLAVDAKLPPALAIEMFYKAGEYATALAIAKREDCFDQLAEESRTRDLEFHAYVLRAWTDRLIETNQPLRALQVTDFLADKAKVDPNLLERRLTWIDLIFSEAPADLPSPEAVARALLSAHWDTKEEVLSVFALDHAIEHDQVEAIALQATQSWINDKGGRLSELFDQLFRMANQQNGEQSSFWKHAAPIVIERVALALISHSGGLLGRNQKDGLQALLRKAGAEVLASDLNKLKLQGTGNVPNQQKWTLPQPSAQKPRVLLGCFIGNDTLLVWRESGLLQLLDPKGRILWQGNVNNVDALIPIGLGNDVIIVQQAATGKMLTRFATSRRAFCTIGQIDLAAYHDITSEGQWLVQIGEQIGALDLAKLCALQPEVEFLWSCKLTTSVQVVSFLQNSGNPMWLTRDISETRRNGLLEAWVLQNGRSLQIWLLNIEANGTPSDDPVRLWHWQNLHSFAPAMEGAWSIQSIPWSQEAESQRLASLDMQRSYRLSYVDQFFSCDRSRSTVEFGDASENGPSLVKCTSLGTSKRAMALSYTSETSLACLARGINLGKTIGGTGDRSALALFADNHGQLILVDLGSQKIVLL